MTVTPLAVALVLVAVAPAVAAGLWWRAARRARRELVGALAAVAEVAGVVPPGDAERRARTAALVAQGLGLDPDEAQRTADAARLVGLAGLVADTGADPWTTARAVARVTTESDIPGPTTAVLDDVLTAHRGRTTRAAAAVRVATTYHDACASSQMAASGALFATVAAHPSGHERRAAALLVRLVQGTASSA